MKSILVVFLSLVASFVSSRAVAQSCQTPQCTIQKSIDKFDPVSGFTIKTLDAGSLLNLNDKTYPSLAFNKNTAPQIKEKKIVELTGTKATLSANAWNNSRKRSSKVLLANLESN